jgi:hypothetical protein
VSKKKPRIGSPNADHQDAHRAPPEATEGREIRHPMYGALKGLIHIMPGTDLTQPADPDWTKICEEQTVQSNRKGR